MTDDVIELQEFITMLSAMCIECGRRCATLQVLINNQKEADYCCRCLPPEFITKPLGEWICFLCSNAQILDFLI